MLQPQQKAWLNNVATVYLQCQQYAKAQPLLLLLIKLYPQDVTPLKQLAYLYYQQGKYELALQCCQRYEKVNKGPADSRIMLLKSFSHLKAGQPELARASYRQFSEVRSMS
jgi:tetratricopeptide (TPR) repeat protein